MDPVIIAAFATMLNGKSPDYQEGYAAGYMAAVEAVEKNRDHFMQLLGGPQETHEEALKRIYSTEWNGSHHNVETVMRDGVDLYVVLPRFWESPLFNNK